MEIEAFRIYFFTYICSLFIILFSVQKDSWLQLVCAHSLTFHKGVRSAKESMTCKADEFCCVDFVMGDAELPASERLNPNRELPDTRCMSGTPRPLVPRVTLKSAESLSFICQTIIICPQPQPHVSVFTLRKNLRVLFFSRIPECFCLFK